MTILISVIYRAGTNRNSFFGKVLGLIYSNVGQPSTEQTEEIIILGLIFLIIIIFFVALIVFMIFIYSLKELYDLDKELLIIEEVKNSRSTDPHRADSLK